MTNYKTIAESNNFIVLDKYTRERKIVDSYQSESSLECELVEDLVQQGYEFLPRPKSQEAMLTNARVQLQTFNHVEFTEREWRRFVATFLDKPTDSIIDKIRKIHDDYEEL